MYCSFCKLEAERRIAAVNKRILKEQVHEKGVTYHAVDDENTPLSLMNQVLHFKRQPRVCACKLL